MNAYLIMEYPFNHLIPIIIITFVSIRNFNRSGFEL